jgi:hypothetical protein
MTEQDPALGQDMEEALLQLGLHQRSLRVGDAVGVPGRLPQREHDPPAVTRQGASVPGDGGDGDEQDVTLPILRCHAVLLSPSVPVNTNRSDQPWRARGGTAAPGRCSGERTIVVAYADASWRSRQAIAATPPGTRGKAIAKTGQNTTPNRPSRIPA